MLIEKGADVNARDHYEETPLPLAARAVAYKLVRVLLEAGADVNARNNYGRTALHRAMYRVVKKGRTRARRTETIRLLLEAGAEGGARDHYEETPLHLAMDLPPDHPAREEVLDLFREYAPEAVMEAYCTQTNTPGGTQQ